MSNFFKTWKGGALGAISLLVLIAANAPGARLAAAHLFVGNASGVATDVAITGDLAISNAGVVTLTANGVASADLDPNVEQVANVQLTNTQVLALRATPVNITSVPAANTAFIVDMVMVVADAAGGAWTESADDLTIEYSGGTDIVAMDGTELVGATVKPLYYYPMNVPVIAAGANTACTTTCGATMCQFGINQAAVGLVVCSDATADSCYCVGAGRVPTANNAIRVLNTGDGEWGGGNAADTLSIRLWYHQVSTVAFSSGG